MSTTTARFLRRERRHVRGTLLAWCLAAAGVAYAWERAVDRGWLDASMTWAALPAIAAIWLLGRWAQRVWRLDDRQLAREIDTRWSLNGRVESAVELRGTDSPLAQAQRTDADAALRGRKPVGTAPWIAGVLAAGAATGLAVTLSLVPRPETGTIAVATAPAPAAHATASPAPHAAAPFRGALTWISPASPTTARVTDEVPLAARAESNRGWTALLLEVALNGTPVANHPVPPAVLASIDAPGAHEVKVSLFVDETGAKPFDIIAYALRGESGSANDIQAVRSPIQLVEIASAGDSPDEKDPALRELKHQLQELKRAEAGLAGDTAAAAVAREAAAERAARTAALAGRQARLSHDAASAQTAAAQRPGTLKTSLAMTPALTAMQEATGALTSGNPASARPKQAQALAALAEAERTLAEASARAAAEKPQVDGKPAAPATPTGEARSKTPAGQLEQLWRRQASANRALEQLGADRGALPARATEQIAIAHDLERLVAAHALLAAVQTLGESANGAAAEAARQLALNDVAAAREPAAQAESWLQRAVERQEREGRKAAAAILEQVRDRLNEAGKMTDPAARQAAQAEVQRELAAEAERQQRQGSSDVAEQLTKLAERAASPPAAAEQPKTTAATPATSDEPAAESEPEAQDGGGEGSSQGHGEKLYRAMLEPPGNAREVRAPGRGELVLAADQKMITVSLVRPPLPSRETAAHVDVVVPDHPPVRLLTLALGTSTRKTWLVQDTAGWKAPEILAALNAGRLRLAIDTVAHPDGELVGFFHPVGAGGAAKKPNRSPPQKKPAPGGVFSGGGHPGAQLSVAMPGVATDRAMAPEALLDLSTAAAEAQVALAPDHSLAQTIRQLKSAAAQLGGREPSASAVSILQLAAQRAKWLAADPQSAEAARAIALATDPNRPDPVSPAALKGLIEQAERLATGLEQAKPAAARDDWVRRFPPEEIDPAYRAPVQTYFETLSREGAAR